MRHNNSKPFRLKNIKWVKVDLRNSRQVDKITRNIDIVIQEMRSQKYPQACINYYCEKERKV